MLSNLPTCPLSLFTTPKSRTAIPIRDPLLHDALRQAALDGSVDTIEYVDALAVGGSNVDIASIVVTRRRYRTLLDIFDVDTPIRDLDEEGLYLLAAQQLSAQPVMLARDEIRREPVASNARQIWAEHDRCVDIDRRLAIADVVRHHGPIYLDDLCREVGRHARYDVFSLACQTVIQLDIDVPLGESIVTLGPACTARCGPCSHATLGDRA